MISIIAAIGKNSELGKDNKLLWHISQDFKRFKSLTTGNVVIMGRKTYESLPEKFRPLPNRINIVITRNPSFTTINQLIVVGSIEEAIESAKSKIKNPNSEIFIIGGASIYEQGIKYADRLYLTLVEREFPEADTFFPDYSQFKKTISEEKHQDDIYTYRFVELRR